MSVRDLDAALELGVKKAGRSTHRQHFRRLQHVYSRVPHTPREIGSGQRNDYPGRVHEIVFLRAARVSAAAALQSMSGKAKTTNNCTGDAVCCEFRGRDVCRT
eukprot:3524711-Rhodomonas_salina.2